MIPIVTPAEMREIDAASPEPVQELISRAGWHVAKRARAMLGGVYGRSVTVIAGPGNNGADAHVAAQLLASWGVRVSVVPPDTDVLGQCDLVIDGAFGTGLRRPYHPTRPPAEVPVLAIDVPSGIDGLTGAELGQPIHADHTVTFAALKPGLLLSPGAAVSGTVEVVDIGLDTTAATAWLMTGADARSLLPRRDVDDHKWRRAVWVIGGSAGMYGAPMLASRSALRSGSGLVWCTMPGQPAPNLASEVVIRPLPEPGWQDSVLADSARFGALVVGCGLGRSESARVGVQALVAQATQPMVIDGDGLRLLGDNPSLRPDIVLTPHDGEYAAITGEPPGLDRFAAARVLAAATGATVLLKGPLTIVASPDGTVLASAHGDERLATAGSGDVLAGMIGSYLAAGMQPNQAAVLAAWVHAAAGRTQGRFGMVASDLVDGLRAATHELVTSAPLGDPHAPN